MSRTTLNPMQIGQTQKVHVKAYAKDPNNATSQIVDGSVALSASPISPGVVTAAIDQNDPRLVVVTAVGSGSATVVVDEVSPKLPTGVAPLLDVTVVAPPPDNRRVDVIAVDDPV